MSACFAVGWMCGPIHCEAAPWQLSQLTPSEMSSAAVLCPSETLIAWQTKQRCAFSAGPIFRIADICRPRLPINEA